MLRPVLLTFNRRWDVEYDLKAIDLEIRTIEEMANKLKKLGNGIEAVERNADAIQAFLYSSDEMC